MSEILAFEAELTTNYTSLVTLLKFFLPHFLDRSVSTRNIDAFDVDAECLFTTEGEGSAVVHHSHLLVAFRGTRTMGPILFRIEGGRTQSLSIAHHAVAKHTGACDEILPP